VDDVCGREKYSFRVQEWVKKYFPCADNEKDEIYKSMRRNGLQKLKNEMDLGRLLTKMRNYDTMFSYLLTARQRFLLKFNDRHVIDSESDLVSLDEVSALFSCESDEDNQERTRRRHIMLKLLEDTDLRNEDCAFRVVDHQLEKGVV